MSDEVTVDGVRLAYRAYGPVDGSPVVLLHALGDSGAGWEPVARGLADTHRVYALDLRGHGDSADPGAYSFELMRDDVRGFLDALGLDAVTLVGHSMGG